MELTFSTDDFAIFDDFLSEDDLATVWASFAEEPLYPLQMMQWARSFKLTDSFPMTGEPVLSSLPEGEVGEAAFVYPTGRALDRVVETVSAGVGNFARWAGTQETDWAFFSCTPYVYPTGAGLTWHEDSTDRTASFVLYVHPEWKPSWGAELLIAPNNGVDRGEEDQPDQVVGHDQGFNDRKRMAMVSEPGFGFYVVPKPNRMVVIGSHVQHTIKKVDLAAGENVRASVTGFFQIPAAQRK